MKMKVKLTFKINKKKRRAIRRAALRRHYRLYQHMVRAMWFIAIIWGVYKICNPTGLIPESMPERVLMFVYAVFLLAAVYMSSAIHNGPVAVLRTHERLVLLKSGQLVYTYGCPWHRIRESLDINKCTSTKTSTSVTVLYGPVRRKEHGHIQGVETMYVPAYFAPTVKKVIRTYAK